MQRAERRVLYTDIDLLQNQPHSIYVLEVTDMVGTLNCVTQGETAREEAARNARTG